MMVTLHTTVLPFFIVVVVAVHFFASIYHMHNMYYVCMMHELNERCTSFDFFFSTSKRRGQMK